MNFDHQQDDSDQIVRGLIIGLVSLLSIPFLIGLIMLAMDYWPR